jgi:hypothetical protein
MSSTMRAPSNYKLQEAVTTLLVQTRNLVLADESLASDSGLLSDYLASDPATCDSVDVVIQLGRAIIATEDMAKMSKERAKQISERGARFKQRADMLRAQLKSVMELLGQPGKPFKISQPDYGASIGRGKARIIITDESKLADEYVKIERTPKLAEIGTALDDDVEVEGAVRGNPEPQLTIRRH